MNRTHCQVPGLLLLAAACLAAPPATAVGLRYEEGRAHDADSGAPIYREQHLVRERDGRPSERLVLYRCNDGTAFARKRVDYRESLLAPAFGLEDARQGYREGLRRGPGTTLWVRETAAAAERSTAVAGAALVADAGFDEFIRRHWSDLLAGKAVPLRFAVPARLESLGFQVSKAGEARLDGEPVVLLRLRLGGWIGWIAPSIEVAYGRDSRRLRRFVGLSNLRDDAGRGQLNARIEFAPTPGRGSEDQWQAFLVEPLAACRTTG